MKRMLPLLVSPLLAIGVGAAPLGTAFTYQGRLQDNGTPANARYDFRFSVYDAEERGNLLGGPATNNAVTVSNGLFVAVLDMGPAAFDGSDRFDSSERWLEIGVRPAGGSDAFVALAPRQNLTATPFAIRAAQADGVPAGAITRLMLADGAVTSSHISDQAVTSEKIADGSITPAQMNQGGNQIFWRTAGNLGTTAGEHFVGTGDDQPLELRVNSQRAIRLEPATDFNFGFSPNIVGGFSGNFVSAGIAGATIGGGGFDGFTNRIAAHYATVGGGVGNSVNGERSVVGGGSGNSANGGGAVVSGGAGNAAGGIVAAVGGGAANTASGSRATIAGGQENIASAFGATIGGGEYNRVTATNATVSGGQSNRASGRFAAIGGGRNNTASNTWSTIGGGENNTSRGAYATIGGGINNRATVWATVGGGSGNHASGGSSTIAGGGGNTAILNGATVGGGEGNTAGHDYATVAGGWRNEASSFWGTVSGGYSNIASASAATVGGGLRNRASGGNATIPGGVDNEAAGGSSLAAGRQARALHAGTFVWADGFSGNFSSTAEGQFLIRAFNGVGIGHNNPQGPLHVTGGADLSPGGGGNIISGPITGGNIGIDGNEIMARNNGAAASLYLNAEGGTVAIGTTTANTSFTLHVNGSAGKPGGGSWSVASDARLKDVGKPFTRGLEAVEKLQPRHYRYANHNPLSLPCEREHVGLIAQEVQQAIPEAIEPNSTGYLHLNNDPILWTMLNSIRQLNEKLEAERSDNAALKRELTELKDLVKSLAHRVNGDAR